MAFAAALCRDGSWRVCLDQLQLQLQVPLPGAGRRVDRRRRGRSARSGHGLSLPLMGQEGSFVSDLQPVIQAGEAWLKSRRAGGGQGAIVLAPCPRAPRLPPERRRRLGGAGPGVSAMERFAPAARSGRAATGATRICVLRGPVNGWPPSPVAVGRRPRGGMAAEAGASRPAAGRIEAENDPPGRPRCS